MDNKNKVASIGFLLCFMAILFGIATNGGLGTIKNFIHIPSLIVTLGGSVFAVMTTADSLDDYIDGFKSFTSAFQKPSTLPEDMSTKILELSDISRKEGLLSLEDHIRDFGETFLTKGFVTVKEKLRKYYKII